MRFPFYRWNAVVVGQSSTNEWEQFRALDFNLMKQRMACSLLVDLRNIYGSDEMERHGFMYVGIGRKSAHAARL